MGFPGMRAILSCLYQASARPQEQKPFNAKDAESGRRVRREIRIGHSLLSELKTGHPGMLICFVTFRYCFALSEQIGRDIVNIEQRDPRNLLNTNRLLAICLWAIFAAGLLVEALAPRL